MNPLAKIALRQRVLIVLAFLGPVLFILLKELPVGVKSTRHQRRHEHGGGFEKVEKMFALLLMSAVALYRQRMEASGNGIVSSQASKLSFSLSLSSSFCTVPA